MDWLPWLLWLHIFGAIVAFGPTFAFPIIGGMGGKEPMHANFATRVTHKISHGMVFPLAVVQGVTGVALIIASNRNLAESRNYWLSFAIVLYVIALGISYFVLTPRVVKLVEMTSTAPPPPAAGMAPSGPPPAIMAAVKGVQRFSQIMTVLVVTIIFLMVLKPGG